MKVLAIDPGPEQSAFVVWDGQQVYERGILPNDVLREYVYGKVGIEYDVLAIERIDSMGMAVGRTTFETCFWIGRFDVSATAILLPRREIKIHLCGSMKAKDANIRQALIDRLGEPGTKKHPGPLYGVTSHMWSALAVAVTAYDHMLIMENVNA